MSVSTTQTNTFHQRVSPCLTTGLFGSHSVGLEQTVIAYGTELSTLLIHPSGEHTSHLATSEWGIQSLSLIAVGNKALYGFFMEISLPLARIHLRNQCHYFADGIYFKFISQRLVRKMPASFLCEWKCKRISGYLCPTQVTTFMAAPMTLIMVDLKRIFFLDWHPCECMRERMCVHFSLGIVFCILECVKHV